MKIVRLLLPALVAAAAFAAVPAAHAAGNCDDTAHDIEVRYRDTCVLADLPDVGTVTIPHLPPIGS